jgi:micrococcal nuclease
MLRTASSMVTSTFPMRLFCFSLVLIFRLILPADLKAQKVVKIVDGDTFHVVLDSHDTVKVRMTGIDTPESRDNAKARKDALRSGQDLQTITALGKKSTAYLERILPLGTTVRLEYDVRQKDRYGRSLAYVFIPGDTVMLNLKLIQAGMASAMTIAPNVKYSELFRTAEAEARRNRVGHWR